MEISSVPGQEKQTSLCLYVWKLYGNARKSCWQLKAQHYHIWSPLNDLSARINIACQYYWEKYLQTFVGEMFSCLEKNTLQMNVAMTW